MDQLAIATPVNVDVPHSSRVDSDDPQNFQLTETAISDGGNSLSSPPPLPSPPLPPRSPRRPIARRDTGASSTTTASSLLLPLTPTSPTTETDSEDMTLLHSRSLGSVSTAFLDIHSRRRKLSTPDKPLPLPPPSPVSIADSDSLQPTLRSQLSSSSLLDTPVPLSKRQHALQELLTSERAYAQDLLLIHDLHIPLALGQRSLFQDTPLTPPASSDGSSSSRAVSTASDASSSSTLPPPMTAEDVRIIFNNVGEIAQFAADLVPQIEDAIGSALKGGTGDDHVGTLFAEMAPKMEPLYTQYITKHSAALEHLNSLPQTPSLTAYLSHTRDLANNLSHAWDLPSLLIKPVQRLLKYSLLLSAIIDETPDTHPDKLKLKDARARMEAVAHKVNEGRRRREVVKEVLTAGSTSNLNSAFKKTGETAAKKKGLNMGIAAAASLARIKSTTRPGAFKNKEGVDGNAEATAVAEMNERLKKYDETIREYAKAAVKWTESAKVLMEDLHTWTLSFGRILGIERANGSDAYDAFLNLIEKTLIPACETISDHVETELLPQLAKLRESVSAPERLLEAMYTLEPLHYGLLNINVAKTRPSPSLLEASKSYMALRGQLYDELPQYLRLLEKGVCFTVLKLAQRQTQFWDGIRFGWEDLWNALKVDTESQSDADETIRVWKVRYDEVLHQLEGLNIVEPPRQSKKEREIAAKKGRARSKSNTHDTVGALNQSVAMLASLDPQFPSSPRSPNKPRSTHSAEAGPSSLERRASTDSFKSKKSGKSGKGPKHRHTHSNASVALYQQEDSSGSIINVMKSPFSSSSSSSKPAYNRAKSMPISSPMSLRRSNSQGKLLDPIDPDIYETTNGSYYDMLDEENRDRDRDHRGRGSRKPSMRRRITDSLRPSPAPSARHRRSPSLSNTNNHHHNNSKPNSAFPSPAHSQVAFNIQPPIPLPPLYSCYVIHPCQPPEGVQYHGILFHTLVEEDIYDVLQECGHPAEHRELPLYVDGGEDCLLLVRNRQGVVGWALASFMLPVD